MAMERDGCNLCLESEFEIEKLSKLLNCTRNYKDNCKSRLTIPYSRPILMQHFPLYRFLIFK